MRMHKIEGSTLVLTGRLPSGRVLLKVVNDMGNVDGTLTEEAAIKLRDALTKIIEGRT